MSVPRNYELRCRDCGKTWGNQPRSICDDCFSPLEVSYDYGAIRATCTRERIAQGPPSMWRYADLLPLPENFQPTVPAGFTPLLKAPRLARQLGAKSLYIKNDAVCLPTLSFKDRVVAVALAQARTVQLACFVSRTEKRRLGLCTGSGRRISICDRWRPRVKEAGRRGASLRRACVALFICCRNPLSLPQP